MDNYRQRPPQPKPVISQAYWRYLAHVRGEDPANPSSQHDHIEPEEQWDEPAVDDVAGDDSFDDPHRVESPVEAVESTTEHNAEGLDLATLIAKSARSRQNSWQPKRRTPRGQVPTFSSAHPDDRDPQQVGETIDRVSAERGWTTNLSVHLLLARWNVLVGPSLADHSRPEEWTDGVLTVRTDSTAWAVQLRMFAHQLLARLNDELGDGTVTLIKVKGPDAPSWKHGPRSVRDGRGPRDTYG